MGAKTQNIFILNLILLGFFPLDSLWNLLPAIFKQIWLPR